MGKWIKSGESEWETMKGKLDEEFELTPDGHIYSNGPARYWLKVRGRPIPFGPFESPHDAKIVFNKKENKPCS